MVSIEGGMNSLDVCCDGDDGGILDNEGLERVDDGRNNDICIIPSETGKSDSPIEYNTKYNIHLNEDDEFFVENEHDADDIVFDCC